MKMLTTIAIVSFTIASGATSGATSVAQYRGQFIFTASKLGKMTKCQKIGPQVLKLLSTYKSCGPAKGLDAPLQDIVGRCENSKGAHAYIFSTEKECVDAWTDLDEGSST